MTNEGGVPASSLIAASNCLPASTDMQFKCFGFVKVSKETPAALRSTLSKVLAIVAAIALYGLPRIPGQTLRRPMVFQHEAD